MHKTKLLQVLPTLSAKELREFQLYVNQFSDRDAIKKLLAHLSTFRGKWEHEDLRLEIVGKNLGYEAPYKSLSNRASDLYKELMKFLVIRKLYSEDYKFEKEFLELKILEDRAIDKLKKLQREKLIRQFNQAKIKDQWSAFRQMLLYDVAYYNSIEENRIDPKKTEIEHSLKLEQHFHVSSRLKYVTELLSRSQIMKFPTEKYDVLFEETLSSQIDTTDSYQLLYQATFRALYTKIPEDFTIAYSLLQQKEELLTKTDRYQIFLYLINAVAQHSRRKIIEYGKQLLALYKFGLPRNILFHQDQITRVTFLNIVDAAAKMHDFAFAKEFIRNYSKKLPEDYQKDTATLAEVMIKFERKEYDEVLQKLRTFNFKYPDEKFRAHILILCTFYDLKSDPNVIWDKCNSFRVFTSRNKTKLNPIFLLGIENFISFVQKLLQQKLSKAKLKNELHRTDPIVMRIWLQEKIQSYKAI